ncbi:MAG: threonine/serine exporter family protein [Natronincolaceae bacterium]
MMSADMISVDEMSVDKKELLVVALYAGEIMLRNGAETYRVEDTIVRLCKSRGLQYVEAYVTPTGIFMSMDSKGESQGEIVSYIKRIKCRGINLNKVAEVNNFSRQFVEGDISLDEALSALRAIDNLKPYSKHIKALAGGGLAGGFFALLLGGDFTIFLVVFMISSIVSYILHYLSDMEFPPFFSSVVGGAMIALLTALFTHVILLTNTVLDVDKVITGAIMPLVPGVAITNALRDSITGDLVSGLSRAAEAVIIATSIAFGVGFILKVWFVLLGGCL